MSQVAKLERDVRLCVDVTESVKPIVGVTGALDDSWSVSFIPLVL